MQEEKYYYRGDRFKVCARGVGAAFRRPHFNIIELIGKMESVNMDDTVLSSALII